MKATSSCSRFFLVAWLVAGAWLAVPDASAQHGPTPQWVAIRIVVDPGWQMFRSYCTPCHGTRGRGDGPAVADLATAPGDLSLLAAHNHGTFPAEAVADILTFGIAPAVHSSSDMPTWGPLLSATWGDEEAGRRIRDLVGVLERLQRLPDPADATAR